MASPFLSPGTTATADSLAILHLRRDQLIPAVLQESASDTGYAEGAVVTTRFGSYPHSTLLGQPWGSQVLASKVDTGSRGKKGGKKRKHEEQDAPTPDEETQAVEKRAAVAASSGFAHLLPPTPESWTISLPHRTQVVYTPDYSYILQRLRVRPGDTIIEAGAGSGSFTHAAARAVFNRYAGDEIKSEASGNGLPPKKRRKYGRVYSYEFHEPRAKQVQEEMVSHGLSSIVTVTHRDVYQDGFLVQGPTSKAPASDSKLEPQASAVFLDLPAPWLAIKHLTRTSSPSPLHPSRAVQICTFSPCIEQVQRTTTTMRELGWLEIEMVEVMHKRLEVRRERVGLQEEGLRGVNATPRTVEEAVGRLRELEGRGRTFRETQHAQDQERKVAKENRAMQNNLTQRPDGPGGEQATAPGNNEGPKKSKAPRPPKVSAKQQRVDANKGKASARKLWKEGRLVHKTEPELKTHTSYLVFAVLPRQWTEADEQKARQRYSITQEKSSQEHEEQSQSSKKAGQEASEQGNTMDTGEL